MDGWVTLGKLSNDNKQAWKHWVELTEEEVKRIKGTLNVDSLQMRTKQVPVLWAFVLLWNLYISSSQTVYPGIKARITQRALDYGELDTFRSQAINALDVACVPKQQFVNWV